MPDQQQLPPPNSPQPGREQNPADAITDALAEDLRRALEVIGRRMEDRFRELVGVPVEYEGKKVIRSKAGEPPRLETGGYQGTFTHVTTAQGDVVRTEAGTADPRGAWFTSGTSRMRPRPHADVVRNEVMEQGEGAILQALAESTGA